MNNFSSLVSKVEESRTLSITALIKKLKAEGEDVLSFSAGEPDFDTPQFVKDAAIKAIQNNFTKYTSNEGTPELIKAIIAKFERDNELMFNPENILVSNGAKHSIFNILLSICNPMDEVIFQSPYWVSYPEMVKLAGAESKIIKSEAINNYKISSKQLSDAISSKTKAIIFNSPSNPTGAVYSKKEILEIAEILKGKDIIIISDEIYEKIIFDDEIHFSIGRCNFLKEQTITINGVSKAYSMTGWRIGYAAGNKDIIRLARNLQSHSTSNACSISQAAAASALNTNSNELNKMVEQFQLRRNFLFDEISKIKGIICPKPLGAFYIFFDVSFYFGKSFDKILIKDSTSFCNFLLNEANVGLVPGIAFGDDNCVRMSYACSMNEIIEGVKRIKSALELIQ